eukprot:334139-Prorocentrum_minimum.AAC.3
MGTTYRGSWSIMYDPDWCSTSEAKSKYFLTADDLIRLDCASVGGGVGCGRPSNYYKLSVLHAAAIRKHGEATFAKKTESRFKRQENKRKREEVAADAKENLPPAGPLGPVDDPGEILKLRKSLLRMSKKQLGFVKWGNTPDKWRVEVPMVSKATFAALVGRPTDTNLTSFVKGGAYYSEDVEATELFACNQDAMEKRFAREAVSEKYGDFYDSTTDHAKAYESRLTWEDATAPEKKC